MPDTPSTLQAAAEGTSNVRHRPESRPYDKPILSGRCALLELPEEILVRIFVNCDRQTLTLCLAVCKTVRAIVTSNSRIQLHHLLQCNSLWVNPHALSASSNVDHAPLSSSDILKRLQDRVERFRTFNPKQTTSIHYTEREGTLYEYLEGVLLKSSGPQELSVYDLRKLSEWEEEEGGADQEVQDDEAVEDTTESEAGRELRTSKVFNYNLREFAVDPGQDLLVVVEVKRGEGGLWNLLLHLLSLSTFGPHPRAKETTLEWPFPMLIPRLALGFQIADEGLFVLKHNSSGGEHDRIIGWQWTTGQQKLNLPGNGSTSFESFVLLSPTSLVIPTIHANTALDELNADTVLEDLTWSHHIDIYSFPPVFGSSSAPSKENIGKDHGDSEQEATIETPTLVARIDLPYFHSNILETIPPPRMSIRTDPPPRLTPPTHPIESPSLFLPTPASGVIIMEISCQIPTQAVDPHYTLCMLKTTLLKYLPLPNSPILQEVDPAAHVTIQWRDIAPHVRFLEGLDSPTWVCYVYQNRYCFSAMGTSDEEDDPRVLRLLDFDPIRVRKELTTRLLDDEATVRNMKPGETTRIVPGPHGIREDGIGLVIEESTTTKNKLLREVIKTGAKLPFMFVDRDLDAEVALVDGERIVGVVDGEPMPGAHLHMGTRLQVMEF